MEVQKALWALCAACDLHGESGTDIMFQVLHEACTRVKKKDYRRIVLKSYHDGLCFDVTLLIADRVLEVMEERQDVQISYSRAKPVLATE
jgi:hypothetical protein